MARKKTPKAKAATARATKAKAPNRKTDSKAGKTAAPAKATSRKASTKPVKARASRSTRPASPNRKPKTGEPGSGFDLAKLIDHPLVADLLAVGAMAAVAAIADHHVKTRTGEAESGSSKAVKAAGKAAAAAIGRRLMTEVDAVKQASAAGQGKRGST